MRAGETQRNPDQQPKTAERPTREELPHPVRRRKGKGLRPALRAPLPRRPGRGPRGGVQQNEREHR